MEKVKTVVRKWGNSFGLVLPKKVMEAERLEEGEEITITVQSHKKMTVGDLMAFVKKHPLPKPKKSYKELLEEVDREFWPEK